MRLLYTWGWCRKEEENDPYSVLYHNGIARWLPGTDPKDPPALDRSHLSAWTARFKLPDYVIVHQRRW